MAKAVDKADKMQARFFDALRDLFVGAKVEGESGFINLMRIKSRYYTEGVFPRLQKDIESALRPFPGFREELFDKLYDFFHRYFSRSGSVYFQNTAYDKSIYERVYTDDRDVVLFWKTHMLYYVKTDRLFRSMEVEVDDRRFYFDASKLEHKRANEKRELVFEFSDKRDDGVLVFTVAYKEGNRKTKLDDIMRQLHKHGVDVKSDSVERAFRVFERQSEVDYFINKNAKAFLREQFDLWLYQYVFSEEKNIWTEQRIKQLQVLKDIAFKIIDFISQFEDELVRIWNKPKFVLNSNYVITLDRIAAKDIVVVERLLRHDGMKAQIQEWRDLGIVGDDFRKSEVLESTPQGKALAGKWQHLPIDTRYFKDLELEILGLFDHLDDELDGRLVSGDSYQVLSTLRNGLTGSIRLVYIDPPYNTEKDDFCYDDKFNRAAWISMLENRLAILKPCLTLDAGVAVQVDFHETATARLVMDQVLGADMFKNEVIWRIGWVSGFKGEGDKFVRNHETIWFYGRRFRPEPGLIPYKTYRPDGLLSNVKSLAENAIGAKVGDLQLRIVGRDGTFYIPEGRGGPREGQYPLEDVWNASYYDELNSIMIMSFSHEKVGDFQTQKPEALIRRFVDAATEQKDLVADFFLGTGTTTATAQKLGRKWLGVEAGAHFWSKALPRMKEVLAGHSHREPCGITKTVSWAGGGFFKYFQLEQYEDCLRRVKYRDGELFDDPNADPYNQYVFLRDLKLLDAVDVDAKKNQVKVDLSRLYDGIDLPETLSNLLGKRIRRIGPGFVHFEGDEKPFDLTKMDFEFFKLIKPLIWW